MQQHSHRIDSQRVSCRLLLVNQNQSVLCQDRLDNVQHVGKIGIVIAKLPARLFGYCRRPAFLDRRKLPASLCKCLVEFRRLLCFHHLCSSLSRVGGSPLSLISRPRLSKTFVGYRCRRSLTCSSRRSSLDGCRLSGSGMRSITVHRLADRAQFTNRRSHRIAQPRLDPLLPVRSEQDQHRRVFQN